MTFEQLSVTKTRSLTGWKFRPLDLENLFIFDPIWSHVISSAGKLRQGFLKFFLQIQKKNIDFDDFWKSELRKNLSIFEIFETNYFRYVCQNNDFHYKASKIRLDVNYKLTNFLISQFWIFDFFPLTLFTLVIPFDV